MLALLLVGCAGSGGGGSSASTPACSASPLLGTWQTNPALDGLKFNSDCTGTKFLCTVAFTYSPTTATSGTVTLTFTSYNSSNVSCGDYDPAGGPMSLTYSIVPDPGGHTMTLTDPAMAVSTWESTN